ncbi:hypothetical protein [Paenibacillus barengoltzii]|uniref:Uracil-DNA glycosylase-like domain-containing protein n=1 Tax=Paenibacillus barengoltzii J12 TaxID=935846 RepID=A0ABY1LU78_9BACL|nr:hypothetical protein [Paenibacillus barengoltzii]SMF01184.1 hypothetical protein SAMN02744124_00801 [Paenibacillus barengoltzii J12]
MEKPVVFGEFVEKNGLTLRKSTYIKFGESNRSIGSALLLNPGSASYSDAQKKEIKPDPTMHQLIKIIHGIYGENITGRFNIYNLFTIQQARSDQAIEELEKHVELKRYDIYEAIPSLDELKSQPWILIGWGVDHLKRWTALSTAKNLWKQAISEAGIPSFGLIHPPKKEYRHPCPHLVQQREEYLREILKEYDSKVK